MTRAVVGIALESLDVLSGAVSLPQFRLLLALDASGSAPSSQIAARLGLGPSSVTRLADRLQVLGLVERGADEANRAIVTVQVTARGHDLVTAVLDRRHDLLAAVLERLGARDRAALARGAEAFAEVSDHSLEPGTSGPVPL